MSPGLCTGILDSIAPFNAKKKKTQSTPWLNDATRDLRRTCRWAERKWQKDRLHVSLQILRSCLSDYYQAVKTAKTQYISTLVSRSSHKPQVLFNTLNYSRNESPVRHGESEDPAGSARASCGHQGRSPGVLPVLPGRQELLCPAWRLHLLSCPPQLRGPSRLHSWSHPLFNLHSTLRGYPGKT